MATRPNEVRFIGHVPGGIKVEHEECGERFCLNFLEMYENGHECPGCLAWVTIPVGVDL